MSRDVRPIDPLPRHQDHHRVAAPELQRFVRNLQLQLAAGVTIVRALEVQIDDAERGGLSGVIRDLLEDLQGGATFGQALERHRCIPALLVSMVQAGEFSGRLPQVLGSVADHLVWVESIKRSVRKAMTYPALVLVACGALLLFILGFLMPSFEPLFAKVGDSLPTSAQILRSAGAFVAAHWLSLVVGGIVGVVGLLVVSRTRIGSRLAKAVGDHAPGFRTVSYEVDMARFARSLAAMLSAGIPLSQAIDLARPAVTTGRLGAAIDSIQRDLNSGTAFQDAFAATGCFSKLATNLVVVGEESGTLPTMFEHLGEHHDARFTDMVDRGLKLLEPAITLVLGLVVGGIAVTIIMTIYKAVLLSGR